MTQRLLVYLSLALSFLLVASFVLFARDQLAGASADQQALIAGHDPGSRPATVHHGQPRRFIDGAAARLTQPFRSLAPKGVWPRELVLTMMGLLVYGVGLGFLARFARGLAHEPHVPHAPPYPGGSR